MGAYDYALDMVGKLEAELPPDATATADPRAVAPPCVLVAHTALEYGNLCGADAKASWEVVALAPGPFNADRLAGARRPRRRGAAAPCPKSRATGSLAYRLALDSPPLLRLSLYLYRRCRPVMPINESRGQKRHANPYRWHPGHPATDVSSQVTNILEATAYSDDGDAVNGPYAARASRRLCKLDGHKLSGTLIQDFDLPEADGGVIDFVWNHSLEVVAFEYTPDDLAAIVFARAHGQRDYRDTGRHLRRRRARDATSDFEWSIEGAPTRTYPTGAADDAEAERVTVGRVITGLEIKGRRAFRRRPSTRRWRSRPREPRGNPAPRRGASLPT